MQSTVVLQEVRACPLGKIVTCDKCSTSLCYTHVIRIYVAPYDIDSTPTNCHFCSKRFPPKVVNLLRFEILKWFGSENPIRPTSFFD